MRRLTLFFSISVNILPLFTETEKNNCFSIYTGSDLNNIFIFTVHFTIKALREDAQLGLAKKGKEIELSICLHEYE